MACCMVFMLLVQLACGQPPEPDPRTRVSVSVSAGRDQEGTQVVEILELCQLQDAATDPLLHNLPLSHCAGARSLCKEWSEVHHFVVIGVVSNHYRSSKVDSRSIFNFLIEPWWCLVPRIVRWSIWKGTSHWQNMIIDEELSPLVYHQFETAQKMKAATITQRYILYQGAAAPEVLWDAFKRGWTVHSGSGRVVSGTWTRGRTGERAALCRTGAEEPKEATSSGTGTRGRTEKRTIKDGTSAWTRVSADEVESRVRVGTDADSGRAGGPEGEAGEPSGNRKATKTRTGTGTWGWEWTGEASRQHRACCCSVARTSPQSLFHWELAKAFQFLQFCIEHTSAWMKWIEKPLTSILSILKIHDSVCMQSLHLKGCPVSIKIRSLPRRPIVLTGQQQRTPSRPCEKGWSPVASWNQEWPYARNLPRHLPTSSSAQPARYPRCSSKPRIAAGATF